MKRTKTNKEKAKVIAILTGDWHLRDSQPICRTDDFQKTQWDKVKFISDLQKSYDCPVICSGDLFDHWKPSPYLLSQTIEHLPDRFHLVYGNHDLPQHNLDLRNRSGVHTLEKAGKVTVLDGCHWGETPDPEKHSLYFPGIDKRMLVWHVMVWMKELPYPGCKDPDAFRLLRKYPEYDIILTGHNHKPFVANMDGRILVNPGCITRQEADQTHTPSVCLLRKDMTVEPVFLPAPDGVMTREHLDNKKERDERLEAFISRLDGEWESTISFRDNLERFFSSNDVSEDVKKIIYSGLDPK